MRAAETAAEAHERGRDEERLRVLTWVRQQMRDATLSHPKREAASPVSLAILRDGEIIALERFSAWLARGAAE